MSRLRPLLTLVACGAALGACADSATGPGREATDPLVAAANRNLSAPVVKTATRHDAVTHGVAGPLGLCQQEYLSSKTTTGSPRFLCDGGGGGAGDPDYPQFSLNTSISSSQSSGIRYVTLTATATFTYAASGELVASFRNAEGCTGTPVEWTGGDLYGDQPPFTLILERNVAYDASATVLWAVNAVASAYSPSGVYGEKASYSESCD